ncbi:MAG: chemotaxis protein CheW [Opitutales bacterium]|nr:chemotaxis protein CheW [Opitutales bacterium]
MEQCCTFWVNGYLFGIDVLKVREIVEFQKSTPVPLSNEIIDGLINLRGEIVTSLDLRKRFPIGNRKETQEPMSIVVITDESPISLIVDEVGDVIDTDFSRMENTPDTLQPQVKSLISGVYKLDRQLMLILDVGAAVNLEEKNRDSA